MVDLGARIERENASRVVLQALGACVHDNGHGPVVVNDASQGVVVNVCSRYKRWLVDVGNAVADVGLVEKKNRSY